MVKNLLEKLQQNFASTILILFYCCEIYNKTIKFFGIELFNVPRLIKSIILLIFFYGLIYKKSNNIIHLIILSVFFSIGQYFLIDYVNTSVVIVFFKYVFVLMLLMYFNTYTLSKESKKVLFKVFETIIVINCLFIIIGFIFEIDILRTYRGNRFGFNGFFVASATGSYVNIIALLYFFIKEKGKMFKNYKVVLLILVMMIIGTKSVYLSLLLLFFVYIKYYFIPVKKIVYVILFVLAITSFYLFFYSFGLFSKITQENGIITSILSYRNELLLDYTLPFIKKQWYIVNYFFGGIETLSTRSQLGFIDVFYFFGLIGGVYYLWLYYKNYFTFSRSKKNVYLFIILIIIIFLSGNFFANTSLPIYLLILKLIIEKQNIIAK